MEQPVPGEHAERLLVALGPALGVHAHPAPLGFGRPLPQAKVRAHQRAEQRQHLGRIVLLVPEPLDPQVLVVGDERRPVVGQDPPVPAGQDDLGVQEVPQDLDRRPLALGGPGPEVIARLADQALELVRKPGDDLRGVTVAEDAEQHLLVLGGPGHRIDASIEGCLGGDRFGRGHRCDFRMLR